MLFGRVARAPNDDLRRRLTFSPDSLQPTASRFYRRVGRPRHEWASKLREVAIRTWGSLAVVQQLIRNEMIWKFEVSRKFSGVVGSVQAVLYEMMI